LQAWPNPFNPMVQIAFRVPASRDLSLTIHDLAGRRVATVVDGYVDAGPRVWTWNGRDGGGRALPSGLYLAHLRTGSARASVKLLLVR
jgi:flagellar hook assembly protein FlgD